MKTLFKEEANRELVEGLIDNFRESMSERAQAKGQIKLEEEACAIVRSELLSALPGPSEWPFVPEDMFQTDGPAQLSEEESKYICAFSQAAFVHGQRHGSCYHGVETSCFASLRLQRQGARVFVMVRLAEARSYLQRQELDPSVEDVVNWLLRLSLEDLPSPTELPSLTASTSKCGDLFFAPAGYVTVDKACVEDNYSLSEPHVICACVSNVCQRAWCGTGDKFAMRCMWWRVRCFCLFANEANTAGHISMVPATICELLR